jgi:hypothetical protein
MKKSYIRSAFVIMISLFIYAAFSGSCRKNTETGMYYLKLTDSPGDYQEVNIDIVGAQIFSEKKGWTDLDVKKGMYNLLTLTNGNTVLIASGQVLTGMATQVRLILGDNNNLKINDHYYNLETPSAEQSGLKINIHDDVMPNGSYTIVLDFDAAKSIVATGNGKYILKPVIRAVTEPLNASIKGTLDPQGILSAVYAVHGTDTFTTYTANNGFFMIQGLYPGYYNVTVVPRSPYNSIYFNSVKVSEGTSTDLGVIELK